VGNITEKQFQLTVNGHRKVIKILIVNLIICSLFLLFNTAISIKALFGTGLIISLFSVVELSINKYLWKKYYSNQQVSA